MSFGEYNYFTDNSANKNVNIPNKKNNMKKTAGDNYEYAMLAEKSSNISSNPLMGGPETVLK